MNAPASIREELERAVVEVLAQHGEEIRGFAMIVHHGPGVNTVTSMLRHDNAAELAGYVLREGLFLLGIRAETRGSVKLDPEPEE